MISVLFFFFYLGIIELYAGVNTCTDTYASPKLFEVREVVAINGLFDSTA